VIAHVDVNAFYASVEVLDDPSLAGKPVIVGGLGARGVVAACTYEARRFGVHSAMPAARARRLCPHAVFLAGRYDRYAEMSALLHEVFRGYTAAVEGIALDEAFLDLGCFADPASVAWSIRRDVKGALGLDVCVGVAASKFLAKLASEAAKPVVSPGGVAPGQGVVVVEPGSELAFLHPLPVRALWGVGPATHRRLERFGVVTVGDLAAVPVDSLVSALGTSLGRHLHELSWARDARQVESSRAVKSVSHEETYAVDLHRHDDLCNEALRLADAVGARLRKAGLAGRTVTVKVRFHDFATITRSQTVAEAVDTGVAIARTATSLLAGIDPSPGVRLLGVGVSNLSEAALRQLTLEETGSWSGASAAVDRIRERFGAGAVGPASLVGRVKRPGDAQWGPD
jgi:DNA polymerase-4